MTTRSNLIFQSPKDGHYFCGYYDKSAIDSKGERLLAQKAPFMDKMPTESDSLVIGYFDLDDKKKAFNPFSSTKAWNWQQGCMLQWLGPDHYSKVIYNDREKDKFVSKIYDFNTGKIKELDMAVYTVSQSGKHALCIDNERLCWFRSGYSYEGIRRVEKNNKLSPDDGIWLIDITDGTIKKIINLMELIEIKVLANMSGSVHYVEHLAFSPSGKRFQFLHRWILPDGGVYTRLYVANIDGSNITLLNDSGRMTHCCWKDDETILGWGAVENTIHSLRKSKWLSRAMVKRLMPLYRMLTKGNSIVGNTRLSRVVTGDGYISIDVINGKARKVMPDLLNRDGHPTAVKRREGVFITDTYANNDGVLDLMVCNEKESTVDLVDRLYSIPEFDSTAMRCDLHPKLSYDESHIAIDTMNEKRRSIYVYKVYV